MRDKAEVDAANAIAAYFVPIVNSSLYTDANALPRGSGPTLTDREQLQIELRDLFNNETLEIKPIAGSTVLRGSVANEAEAEAILNFLPSLNQVMQPFLTIRGGDEVVRPYLSETPVLFGEDYAMTRTLREVTKISTVYVKRTAQDGIAVYGTVRNRSEFDTVQRFIRILPIATAGGNAPAANASGPQGASGKLDENSVNTNAPFSNNSFPIGIQMFVRILNPAEATICQVSIQSSLVEVNRTSLKNLGVELGAAPTGSTLIIPQGGGSLAIGGPGPLSVTNAQVRFNALVADGRAKILSQPNVMAVEGASAQIIVGGQRPCPDCPDRSRWCRQCPANI